jgi:alkylation response protein AidB-like acyl-CoA dehydrogenase
MPLHFIPPNGMYGCRVRWSFTNAVPHSSRAATHPIQLYFKRARSSEILLGAPAYHRELLARHLAL